MPQINCIFFRHINNDSFPLFVLFLGLLYATLAQEVSDSSFFLRISFRFPDDIEIFFPFFKRFLSSGSFGIVFNGPRMRFDALLNSSSGFPSPPKNLFLSRRFSVGSSPPLVPPLRGSLYRPPPILFLFSGSLSNLRRLRTFFT